MDALKILCRSTTLSRKSGKQPPRITRPSSGEASNPQLFGKDVTDGALASGHSSKKRKRSGSISPPVERDPQLDFFNARKAAAANAADDAVDEQTPHKTPKRHLHVDNDGQVANVQAEDLPEDECRRILKVHKLKITPIWPQQEEKAAVAPTPKRKGQDDNTLEPRVSKSKSKKRRLDIVPQPLTSFAQLQSRYRVGSQLARNIEEQGYTIPTEVQLGALPLLLGTDDAEAGLTPAQATKTSAAKKNTPSGPNIDLLTVAPTGSGKTLAYLIPIVDAIAKLKSNSRHTNGPGPLGVPSAIVVAPTKELATQITNEARKLAAQTGISVAQLRKGMKFAIGSDDQNDATENEEASDDFGHSSDEAEESKPLAHSGPADVLVTTPLTLVKAMVANKAGVDPLSAVRYLVLDEADVLLDSMFRSQTLKIWSACTNNDLRVSLWSATMGSSIEEIATTTILSHRKNTSTQKARASRAHANAPSPSPSRILRLVVGLKDSAIPSVQHKLIYAANEAGKLLAMRQLLRPTGAPTSTEPRIQPPFLVFTQTIPRAIALASELRYDIPPQATTTATTTTSPDHHSTTRLAVLHANLPSAARTAIMARFRAGDIWVLITTDLLARGVDFRGVNAVVNYDIPGSSAAYVHRVGRTGRAGRAGGVAVSLYADEDVPVLRNVVNVVRAAERAGRAAGGAAGGGGGGGVEGEAAREGQGDAEGGADAVARQEWLFRALPKLSKRDKQLVRKRGVEARRAAPNPKIAGGDVARARTRISTKSGYDRKVENRRKAAVAAQRERRKSSNAG